MNLYTGRINNSSITRPIICDVVFPFCIFISVGNKKVNPDGIPIIPKFTSTQTQEIVNMGILEDSFFKFISEFTVTK